MIKSYPLLNGVDQKETDIRHINELVDDLKRYTEEEVIRKAVQIQALEHQISRLNLIIEKKDLLTDALRAALEECRSSLESSKQLTNKILNDVAMYQKEVSWYKRLSEKRSGIGNLVDKVLGTKKNR